MPAINFTPGALPISWRAVPIGVFLWNGAKYTRIPNVRCEQIQFKEGAEPPSARFSYILDSLSARVNGWPSQFEQLWTLGVTSSKYKADVGDEIVVIALLPNGRTRILFDGYPRMIQSDIESRNQSVTFMCVGQAINAWNQPLGHSPWRDSAFPYSGTRSFIHLPWLFNPAGTGKRTFGGILPNCTPDGFDVDQATATPYPVFLDPTIDRTPDPRTYWDLAKAVRTILAANTSATGRITNPSFAALTTLLQNRMPVPGLPFDPKNPATFNPSANVIRSYNATNKAWPEAIEELLGYYGFGMAWVTDGSITASPFNGLKIYRKDAIGNLPKQVFLPKTGAFITQTPANLASFHAAFDFQSVANAINVETHVQRWEISVILAPAFQPQAGDSLPANRTQFLRSNIDTAEATEDQRKAYRDYVVDECTDGHWDTVAMVMINNVPFDFSPVFPPDPNGNSNYLNRYRPGKNSLFSRDLNNKPYPAQLAVSRDWTPVPNKSPCFWDGTSGTWQNISSGSWELMKDRLGVRVTVDDVEAWHIGKPKTGNAPNGQPWPVPSGVLRGIASVADPSATDKGAGQIYLRLTTVIESDHGIPTFQGRRLASPLPTEVIRRIDATDHFYLDSVLPKSLYWKDPMNPNIPMAPVVAQDDTVAANAHASQLRSAHEFPPLTASLVIPQLMNYIHVGDRINIVKGRNVSLQTNGALAAGEAPFYPFVVALTWDFQGEKQTTTLQLSDRRSEPPQPVGRG